MNQELLQKTAGSSAKLDADATRRSDEVPTRIASNDVARQKDKQLPNALKQEVSTGRFLDQQRT
jgi:hypothetical protein